jgi:murein DD-endopeptidase MepM/ murein hydrolase activator NlpD
MDNAQAMPNISQKLTNYSYPLCRLLCIFTPGYYILVTSAGNCHNIFPGPVSCPAGLSRFLLMRMRLMLNYLNPVYFSCLIALLLVGLSCPPGAYGQPLQAPARLVLGQPALVKWLPAETSGENPAMWFMDRNFPLYQLAGNKGWVGIIGVDLRAEPGQYMLKLERDGQMLAGQNITVRVNEAAGTRNITVEEKYVSPSERELERINRETRRQLEVYQLNTAPWRWGQGLNKPLESAIVGRFGRSSIINGQPRAPHGGVDLRGSIGAPVQAPAPGRVALTLDSYFSGLMVLLDHGQGLISGYRHLSEIMVKEGDMVIQGQIIGRVGASGRVTGPHLHFDIHLKNATIDPLEFVRLSREMAKLILGNNR